MRSFLSRRVGLPVWALAVIVVVSIGLGGAGGSSSSGNEAELAAANKARSQAEDRASNAEREARAKVQAELQERDDALTVRSAQLDAREAKVTQEETAAKATTIDRDGVYEVGVDIQPGKWKTSGEGQSCYWETTSKGGDIMDNDNVSGPTVVVIPASAFSFTSKDCGTWHKTG